MPAKAAFTALAASAVCLAPVGAEGRLAGSVLRPVLARVAADVHAGVEMSLGLDQLVSRKHHGSEVEGSSSAASLRRVSSVSGGADATSSWI